MDKRTFLKKERLLDQLRNFDLDELMIYYIEAKTETYLFYEDFPPRLLKAIDKLESELNKITANRRGNNFFIRKGPETQE